MTKKRNWLGMVAVLAVVAVVAVGCDDFTEVLVLGGENGGENGGEKVVLSPEEFLVKFLNTWEPRVKDFNDGKISLDDVKNAMKDFCDSDELDSIDAGTRSWDIELFDHFLAAIRNNDLKVTQVRDDKLKIDFPAFKEDGVGTHNIYFELEKVDGEWKFSLAQDFIQYGG
jgi:hypothetical protein